MSDLDRIFDELVTIHRDLHERIARDDFDARARLSWRRRELHAEAARLAV